LGEGINKFCPEQRNLLVTGKQVDLEMSTEGIEVYV